MAKDVTPVPYPKGDECLQANFDELWELQSASGEELSPALHFGDDSQSALMPSILDKAFKGEL